MYTVVMIMLSRVTRKFKENFEKEVNSVNCQFLVFLIAYVSRILISIPLEIQTLKDLLGKECLLMIHLILSPFIFLVPTFIVLNMHHKSFKAK